MIRMPYTSTGFLPSTVSQLFPNWNLKRRTPLHLKPKYLGFVWSFIFFLRRKPLTVLKKYMVFMIILTKKRSELPKRVITIHFWRCLQILVKVVSQRKNATFPRVNTFFGQYYPVPYDEKFNDWFIMIRYDSLSLQQKRTSVVRKVLIIPRNPTFFTPFCVGVSLSTSPSELGGYSPHRTSSKASRPGLSHTKFWGQFEGTTEKNGNYIQVLLNSWIFMEIYLHIMDFLW